MITFTPASLPIRSNIAIPLFSGRAAPAVLAQRLGRLTWASCLVFLFFIIIRRSLLISLLIFSCARQPDVNNSTACQIMPGLY
ncbi:MAG TPA: hypothetical protein VGB67_09280 [Fibrella sp.]